MTSVRRSTLARAIGLCLLASAWSTSLRGEGLEDRLGSARGFERLRLLNELSRQEGTRSQAKAEWRLRSASSSSQAWSKAPL